MPYFELSNRFGVRTMLSRKQWDQLIRIAIDLRIADLEDFAREAA
jgi:hypothetical protein